MSKLLQTHLYRLYGVADTLYGLTTVPNVSREEDLANEVALFRETIEVSLEMVNRLAPYHIDHDAVRNAMKSIARAMRIFMLGCESLNCYPPMADLIRIAKEIEDTDGGTEN